MEEVENIRRMRWSLQGTTALVTGGTKGIGHAIVEELAGFGAVVYTCSRNETELNKCLQEWKNSGFSVAGSVCDVSSRAERVKLMEGVSSMFNGKLNILEYKCCKCQVQSLSGYLERNYDLLDVEDHLKRGKQEENEDDEMELRRGIGRPGGRRSPSSGRPSTEVRTTDNSLLDFRSLAHRAR